MTSNTTTIIATKKFTVSLAKAELDSIQKQFLEEMDEMLNKVRRKNNSINNNFEYIIIR